MPTVKVEFASNVKADPGILWEILTDVESWNQWLKTSYTKANTPGPLKNSSMFFAELSGVKWKLTVTKAERPENISWTGRRFGIKAVHDWEFIKTSEGTKVITREVMSGWLLFLIYPVIKARLSKFDEKWLVDLKLKAETIL